MIDQNTPPPHFSGDSFDYTAEQITEMCETWHNFNGFEGYECGSESCKKKLNVLTMGPGFICPCGHFNVQSFHGGRAPFESPDYGPSLEVVQEGIRNSPKWQKIIKGDNDESNK